MSSHYVHIVDESIRDDNMTTFKGSRNDEDGSGLEKEEGTTENKDEDLIVDKENVKKKSSIKELSGVDENTSTFKAEAEVKGNGSKEAILVP